MSSFGKIISRDKDNMFIKDIIEWCNINAGFLTLIIFIISILLGWVSGIFTHIKRKPKLELDLINIPSFLCLIKTGRKKDNIDTYRTAIVLYLRIKNIGNISTSVTEVRIGYKIKSKKYIFKHFWLNSIVALEDFSAEMNGYKKVYPFFTQQNALIENNTNLYLREGEEKNGIEYFESPEFWGDFEPIIKNNKVHILLEVTDTYEKKYYKTLKISIIDYEEAKRFNSQIGMSREMSSIDHPHQSQNKYF